MALDARVECKQCVFRHGSPERKVRDSSTSESQNRKRSMTPNPALQSHTVAQPAARAPSRGWALGSLCLSMLLPSLDTSIANAGLPSLASAFKASFQAVQWIVLAYLLAITTLIVSAGRIADLAGRRQSLLVGIVVFTVASLLCGRAPSLGLLIAARALQGLGAAVMMAVTIALVAETVPKTRTGSAMGLLGSMSAVGTTLGPSLGGVLIAGPGWRSLFLINVPLGALTFAMAYCSLPRVRPAKPSAPGRPARFDTFGTLLLTLSLAAYALAMTTGHGHFGNSNLVLLLAAAIGSALFVFVEGRAAAPLVRPALFRDRRLSASLAMSVLVATVIMATLVVGPFYLSRALGLSASLVGVVASVGPLVAALTGIPAGGLVDRFGVGAMSRIGLSGMAAGCFSLSVLPARFGVVGYAAPILLTTAGYALFQAANNTSLMQRVSADQRGVVAGMLSLSRNLGLITGASLMGAVFTTASGSGDISTAHPEAVAAGMRTTFQVAALLIVGALVVATATRDRRLSRGAALSQP